MSIKKYCITGGSGYLGYHIGKALIADGNMVVLFDRSEPIDVFKDSSQPDVLTGFTYVQGNVCNLHELYSAFAGIDCVIHTAAFGMSNREQLCAFWDEVEKINIGGTKNVIEACCRQNVPALVFTSSNTVVFDGHEIMGGDESLPYVPNFKHMDHYSRTKAIAEQMVLLVNGKILANGQGHLWTCALRLAGIVGPKEQRHIPRSIDNVRSGLVMAKFWYNEGLSDFLFIHNAVSAHILAAQALMDDHKRSTVGGQPYFISDGQPTNTFKFFLQIAEGLDYRTPKLRIPASIVWIFVLILELIPYWLFVALNMGTLTRTEFLKLTTTNSFSIEKARRELGYCPTQPNDISETIAWLRQSENADDDDSGDHRSCRYSRHHCRRQSSKCRSLFRNVFQSRYKFLSVLMLIAIFLISFLII